MVDLQNKIKLCFKTNPFLNRWSLELKQPIYYYCTRPLSNRWLGHRLGDRQVVKWGRRHLRWIHPPSYLLPPTRSHLLPAAQVVGSHCSARVLLPVEPEKIAADLLQSNSLHHSNLHPGAWPSDQFSRTRPVVAPGCTTPDQQTPPFGAVQTAPEQETIW